MFPFGFFTHKKLLSHSIGSPISALCRIFSSTNLSSSFLSVSCIAWGTHLTGSTCGIAPSFSFMLISQSIRPISLNSLGYSDSVF